MTADELHRLSPFEVEAAANAQLEKTRGPEHDGALALHLVIALARHVQLLEFPLT